MRSNESSEDYLETILILGNRSSLVRAVDIAAEMGFKKPSVSVAMKNLRQKNLITVADNGDIRLTEDGHKIADKVYERHQLISSWLMILGVQEKTAIHDACRIEHIISEESFQALIRHGDPDYTIDSLTEKGWKEAEFLSEKIAALDVRDFYVSPLGRAKDTASCTLKKNGRTATECKWLREFDVKIRRPDLHGEKIIPWDWLPQDWTKIENFYSFDRWWDNDILREGKMKEEYDWVTQNFDKVLAEHGYVREGHYYRAEKANEDTLVFFCHFGVSCVLISYLLSISPLVMLQNFCAAPSSVSTIVTEERRKGIASFRMSSFGDISHLYAHQEPPAFAARFCETYDNKEQRHD